MANKLPRDTRKQVAFYLKRAFVNARNPRIRFNEETQVQLLLSKSVDEINVHLCEIFVQTSERFPFLEHVKENQLYVVYSPSFEPEGFQCFLGGDITSPCFSLDTVDQLTGSCEWHNKHSTFESKFCVNLDLWAEYNLRICLCKLETYKTLLSLGLRRWQDVFLEESRQLQRSLLDHQFFLLKGLRVEISELKRRKAPEFMIDAAGQNVERIKKTIHRLGQTLPY